MVLWLYGFMALFNILSVAFIFDNTLCKGWRCLVNKDFSYMIKIIKYCNICKHKLWSRYSYKINSATLSNINYLIYNYYYALNI